MVAVCDCPNGDSITFPGLAICRHIHLTECSSTAHNLAFAEAVIIELSGQHVVGTFHSYLNWQRCEI